MIKYYIDKELSIYSDIEPSVCVRVILPNDTTYIKKDKKRKPYLNNLPIAFLINYKTEVYNLSFEEKYTWDGASIPTIFRPLVGKKGSLEFLIPSMVHDKMCENHNLVNNNRNLSSKIFRALLISMGVGKMKANTMYYAVDNFQKFCHWEN